MKEVWIAFARHPYDPSGELTPIYGHSDNEMICTATENQCLAASLDFGVAVKYVPHKDDQAQNSSSPDTATIERLRELNMKLTIEAEMQIRDIIYLRAVAAKSKQVRGEQLRYFRTRNREDLIASKKAEKELDELLRGVE